MIVDAHEPSAAAVAIATLAAFDGMTSARLRALRSGRTASEALAIAAGHEAPPPALRSEFARYPKLRARWLDSARRVTCEAMRERLEVARVAVVLPDHGEYPASLVHDPRRPEVLFVRGRLGALDGRRVGIVGTRNPTQRGVHTAKRFGSELAEAGVCVVSGLALGIDGAVHRGALEADGAAPVAVVASGLDDPYPRRHAGLWAAVAERGAVISEWPPGTRPEPFRFPQRNRILAALSEVVVVVESRERGGSLITAREAAERGIDVFAVPGSIDQRASRGTNALLEDGAAPVVDVGTLLTALDLDHRRSGRRAIDLRPTPVGIEHSVHARCVNAPQTVESIAVQLSLDLGRAAMALARLERAGWLAESGGWFEALERPNRPQGAR
ncbi:MAG: DNA-processing protein DprA [Ilumatobacter sp.]